MTQSDVLFPAIEFHPASNPSDPYLLIKCNWSRQLQCEMLVKAAIKCKLALD